MHKNIEVISGKITKEEKEARNSDAYYQALQDWQRGGANQEDAFRSRGFIRNENGNWVFEK